MDIKKPTMASESSELIQESKDESESQDDLDKDGKLISEQTDKDGILITEEKDKINQDEDDKPITNETVVEERIISNETDGNGKLIADETCEVEMKEASDATNLTPANREADRKSDEKDEKELIEHDLKKHILESFNSRIENEMLLRNDNRSNQSEENNSAQSSEDEDLNNKSCTRMTVDDIQINKLEYRFKTALQLTSAWREFKSNTSTEYFLKGCKWSVDGTCVLTNCEDKNLRIFDMPKAIYNERSWPKDKTLPDMKSSLKVDEGGLIYDYCWYPLMNSWNPVTCCFVASPSDEPVHLRDAFTGELRASYRSYNYADELLSAYSLAFNPSGERLYCGFNNSVKIFDTMLPGRKSTTMDIKKLAGMTGIVSCIVFNPGMPSLYAIGTYTKTVGLFSEGDGTGFCVFQGHSGGLTHMRFSPDGNRLYTGGRKDPEIVCWDIRNPGKVLFSLCRTVSTNQRIYFDISPDGNTLLTGNTDGTLGIWDVNNIPSTDDDPREPDYAIQVHKDCCNGVSINPHYPIVATSSGQRHVADLISDDDDDADEDVVKENDDNSSVHFFDINSLKRKREDSVKLWWVGDVS